jgi:hypothetical protein
MLVGTQPRQWGGPPETIMTTAEIAIVIQSITATSVAGSLVFAAYQFRHLRRAQHVANFTKMVELQMHLREMRVHDPHLARTYSHDVEYLAGDKDVREYFFNLMQLSVYEIVWFSYREGQLPEDYYRSWEKRMQAIAAEPSFRRMVSNPSMKIHHDEFQTYIQQVVKDTPPRHVSG